MDGEKMIFHSTTCKYGVKTVCTTTVNLAIGVCIRILGKWGRLHRMTSFLVVLFEYRVLISKVKT